MPAKIKESATLHGGHHAYLVSTGKAFKVVVRDAQGRDVSVFAARDRGTAEERFNWIYEANAGLVMALT